VSCLRFARVSLFVMLRSVLLADTGVPGIVYGLWKKACLTARIDAYFGRLLDITGICSTV